MNHFLITIKIIRFVVNYNKKQVKTFQFFSWKTNDDLKKLRKGS